MTSPFRHSVALALVAVVSLCGCRRTPEKASDIDRKELTQSARTDAQLQWACGFSIGLSRQRLLLSPSTTEAEEAIRAIVRQIGLPANFEIYQSDIGNAAATVVEGKRLILYDSDLINKLRPDASTRWSSTAILAHEIGHHLSGHTLNNAGSTTADELAADKFSGFVLNGLGATLEQAQAAVKLLASEAASGSHPGRSARLVAVATGWKEADLLRNTGALPPPPPDDDLALLNQTRFDRSDFYPSWSGVNADAFDCPVSDPEIVHVYSVDASSNPNVPEFVMEDKSGQRTTYHAEIKWLNRIPTQDFWIIMQLGRRLRVTSSRFFCGGNTARADQLIESVEVLPAVER